MNLRRPILGFLFCAAASIPSLAAPREYVITQEQIAAVLASGGMGVAPNQVSPLAKVVARVADPALKVISIQKAGDRRMIARLECAHAAECLPFLVAVRVEDGASAPVPPSGLSQPQSLLVRAGSSATLLLDGTHVHISIPVICLENGSMGQRIRVANPDRSKFYTVQVAGDRLLRGAL